MKAMQLDDAEVRRLRTEREQTLIATSRGKKGIVQSWGMIVLLAAIGAIPGTARALGVTVIELETALGAMFVCSIPATVVFQRGGVGTRAFFVAVAFETIAFLGGALALVERSGNVVSVFWLWYAAYLFINTIVDYRRAHVPVAIGVLSALIASYVAARDYGSATVALFIGASVLATFQVLSVGRRRLEEAEARQLLLERQLERERIARDLHDGLGAELAAMLWKARELDAPELSEGIGAAIRELREIVVGMRDAPLERGALAAYLRGRLGRIVGDRVTVVVDSSGDDAAELEPKVAAHLVRAAMEGARNAMQHGRATRVTVRLLEDALEIEDDGVGLPDAAEALGGDGVGNLRARARALGQELDVGSGEGGKGTRIRLPFGPRSTSA